ncbi:ferredoxin III, nif-specific [Roseospira goensis]|uniref:Ferredoxin III n=1 Tax=Roseospira goensis TaxID=391922 RepID=A0A7W6S0Y0_9PROT|nr:ferredoxin III, nif-specific [Roseospira goensis]MBB4286865.1 Nif-specific ferredoxin III [Roseospira goensis]
MSVRTFATRDGRPWVPSYLEAIDPDVCIGCGRCVKVCARDVIALRGVTEDGDLCDPFDDDEEIERKISVLVAAGDCVGCGSCATVCGTGAQHHAPVEEAA